MNTELFEAMLVKLRRERSRDEHISDAKLLRARYLLGEKQKLLKKLTAIDSELQSMGSEASNV